MGPNTPLHIQVCERLRLCEDYSVIVFDRKVMSCVPKSGLHFVRRMGTWADFHLRVWRMAVLPFCVGEGGSRTVENWYGRKQVTSVECLLAPANLPSECKYEFGKTKLGLLQTLWTEIFFPDFTAQTLCQFLSVTRIWKKLVKECVCTTWISVYKSSMRQLTKFWISTPLFCINILQHSASPTNDYLL
jgi:hypothetical protein